MHLLSGVDTRNPHPDHRFHRRHQKGEYATANPDPESRLTLARHGGTDRRRFAARDGRAADPWRTQSIRKPPSPMKSIGSYSSGADNEPTRLSPDVQLHMANLSRWRCRRAPHQPDNDCCAAEVTLSLFACMTRAIQRQRPAWRAGSRFDPLVLHCDGNLHHHHCLWVCPSDHQHRRADRLSQGKDLLRCGQACGEGKKAGTAKLARPSSATSASATRLIF
jgi:hypothetical protein